MAVDQSGEPYVLIQVDKAVPEAGCDVELHDTEKMDDRRDQQMSHSHQP